MTAATATAAPTTSGRAGRIALAVLQGLIVVAYLFSAYSKLTADPQAVAGFELMGIGNAGLYTIGAIELLGALGLLVPRLMGLAATGLVLLMVGAVVATIVFMPALVAIPAVYLVLVSILAYGRRRNTAALIASLRR